MADGGFGGARRGAGGGERVWAFSTMGEEARLRVAVPPRPGAPPSASAMRALRGWVKEAFGPHGGHSLRRLDEVLEALGASGVALTGSARPLEAKVASVVDRLERAASAGYLRVELAAVEPPPRHEVGPELPPPSPLHHDVAWIALRVIDQDGAPVPRRGFRITRGETVLHEGFLDGAGAARVEDLPPGAVRVVFPDIDPSERNAAEVMPGKRRNDSGPLEGEAATDAEPHVVQAGESLSSIADQHFFLHWVPIWNHASNRALRSARDNPQCLLEGDIVNIPQRKALQLDARTESELTVTVHVQKPALRLRLVDAKGAARKGLACSVAVDGAVQECSTDGDGILDVRTTPSARFATVTIEDEEPIEVQIGGLAPIGEAVGVEGRLLDAGLVAPFEPLTESRSLLRAEADGVRALGIERFERREKLEVDGKISDTVRDLLAKRVCA